MTVLRACRELAWFTAELSATLALIAYCRVRGHARPVPHWMSVSVVWKCPRCEATLAAT